MKIVLGAMLVAILLSACMTNAKALTASVEYRLIRKGGTETTAMLLAAANRFHNSSFGSFAWGRVQQKYAQAYAGPTWTPTRGVTLGIGVGLEQNPRLLRTAGFVSAEHGKAGLYVLQQQGGSGRYTKLDATYRIVPTVKLGWLYETPLGSEAKVECALPRFPVRLWAAASTSVHQAGLVYQF